MKLSHQHICAEIALNGITIGLYKEAESIANWLLTLSDSYHETAYLILLTSAIAQKKYSDALVFDKNIDSISLQPWLALCEFHLNMHHALRLRLQKLSHCDDKNIIKFIEELKNSL